jgi:hypothetical protein
MKVTDEAILAQACGALTDQNGNSRKKSLA